MCRTPGWRLLTSQTARPARLPWAVAAASALLITAGCSESPPDREPIGGPVPDRVSPQHTSVGAPERVDPTGEPIDTEASTPDGAAGDVAVVETIATGLRTPWDVDFLPDGSALVTLRDTGEVLGIDSVGTTALDAGGPEGTVPEVRHETEDGLLGLAVGPDDGIYMYLTTSSDNRVLRYDLDGDALLNPKVILEGIPAHSHHDGGRIAFGPDGYLYVTTGDTQEKDLAQDKENLAGKILRVTTTGAPAPGNPFDNEVWSYGHRNVQGLGWTSDGRMYASEFGSSEFDELNLIEPGGNYGWPHVEGWAGDPDYVDPLVTWSTDEASPSGIAVTDEGVWMAALRGERLWYVPLGADGEVGEPREHQLGLGRLRAVVTAPDGGLWVVTSNTDGRGDPGDKDDQIVRLETY